MREFQNDECFLNNLKSSLEEKNENITALKKSKKNSFIEY